MWNFKMRYRRRKGISKEYSKISIQVPQKTQGDGISTPDLNIDTRTPEAFFAAHISKYIGETVIVFVKSGGESGSGFTGILLKANVFYIQLITRIGPAPSFLLANNCANPPYCWNILHQIPWSNTNNITGIVNVLGSNTYIPMDKIVSFVHNTI